MIRSAPLLALLLAAPAFAGEMAASPSHVTLEQEAALRCSAVFAIVAAEQGHHDPVAVTLPPLGTRGREFFVLTTARLMDESGATREHVRAMFKSRYEEVRATLSGAKDPVAARHAMMQPCMALLDVEVPAKVGR